MDEGLKGLDESHGRLGESYEDGHELDGLDEQLGKYDEDCLRFDKFFFNSASQMNLDLVCMHRGRTRRVFAKLDE